jgi:hypothetical protein
MLDELTDELETYGVEFENNVAISLQKAILEVKNNKIDFVSWEEFWKFVETPVF